MGSVNLPFVDAVTAVEDTDGKVVLIGVGDAGYDRRKNVYHMRSNGVIVDDIAKEVGGKQSFTVTDDIEIMALKIYWITPPVEEVTPQSIRRAKRAVKEYQLKVPGDGEEIFCHILSDYLFVRCIQRESQSHGAYQDYIREVGASEVVVTDNSKNTN